MIITALLANLGIVLAKFVAFSITGAASLLAEAVHSVADTTNQGLLLLGGLRAGREPTAEHPFGYGRERYFWAFIVALLLFTLGGLYAVSEGIQRLRHPQLLEAPIWAIAVLVIAIALEGVSLHTAVRESNRLRGRESWWTFIRRAKIPELPVVLLEDLGALLGLLLALIGISLTLATGEPRYDALGSIAIGALLTVIAVVLAAEMKSLLIGESARPNVERAIASALAKAPDIRRIIHLRTLHLGPDEVLVTGKVELDPTLDVAGVAAAINDAKARVRSRVPVTCVIFLEPDVYHG